MNIARFVRTSILKKICERLLLAVAPRDAFRALSNIYDEVFLQMGQSIQECSKYSRKLNHMVGNKKRVNLKTGVTRKQSAPNFPKNEHFLPPIRTLTTVYQGVRNVPFSENLAGFVFL